MRNPAAVSRLAARSSRATGTILEKAELARARPFWVNGGCRRHADVRAGLPPAPEMYRAPGQLGVVPLGDFWVLASTFRSLFGRHHKLGPSAFLGPLPRR
jgi:hypothetical protein